MTCEIFGILNITPDSFSDGGKFLSSEAAIAQGLKMMQEGASFIDIGGESTRPNSTVISPEKEWRRIEKPMQEFLSDENFRNRVSLDTQNWETAEKFFRAGGVILNSVSGLPNKKMQELAAEFAEKVIVGHFPGKNITEVHEQKISSVNRVRDELLSRHEELIRAGIAREKIVLDPNIGFGKTMECNWELLKFAALVPEYKVMIGHSRKRFLGERRLEIERNLEAAQVALVSGARYLRVHDVKEHMELLNQNS